MDLILWQFIRASGLLAFGLLSVAMLAGIMVKTRAADALVKRAWVFEAHQSLTIASLGLIVTHVALILLNSHVGFSPAAALIPFVSGWRPLPIALGILGLYLTIALVASSYLRSFIGQKSWRTLHFASFLAWFAALMHGITAGSDSGLALIQWSYWLAAVAVVGATAYRILQVSAKPQRSQTAPAQRLAS
jgi:predicted ferric reductase